MKSKSSRKLDDLVKLISAANSNRRLGRMSIIMQAQEINKQLSDDELIELLSMLKKWSRGMVDIMLAVGIRKAIYKDFYQWYYKEFCE